MAFSGSGAGMGAATGAAVGTMVMPGLGTGVGAALGALGGGFLGGMKSSSPGIDWGMVKDRRAEIESFAGSLATARAKYLTSLGNMYNQAYSRFSANVEPGFATRGLQVNGGAFASALAKQTADYQSQMESQAYGMERQDLNTVEAMRQNTFASIFGQSGQMSLGGFQEDRADERSLGGFAGQLAMMGAQKYMNRGSNGYNNYSGGSSGWSSDGVRTGTMRNGQVQWDSNSLNLR